MRDPAVTAGPDPAAKAAAAAVVDDHLDELVALSHAVHATPELCFEETDLGPCRGRGDAGRRARGRRGRLRPADGARVALGRGGARGGGLRRVRRAARRRPRLRAQHHRRHRRRRRPGSGRRGRRRRAHGPGARHAGRGGRRRQGPDARARRLRRRPRRHDGPPVADRAAHRDLPRRGALRRLATAGGRRTPRPRPGRGSTPRTP